MHSLKVASQSHPWDCFQDISLSTFAFGIAPSNTKTTDQAFRFSACEEKTLEVSTQYINYPSMTLGGHVYVNENITHANIGPHKVCEIKVFIVFML